MRLKSLTPNLMVEDVNRIVEFYRDVLSFDLLASVPEGGEVLDWAMMQRDGARLMFQSRSSLSSEVSPLQGMPIGASQTFYVEVADIQPLYDQLTGKVDIINELHSTFYNTREFYFRDPNGYIFGFSEELS
jgi:uncharacterized glyoxalase superfamily protein PhnB